MKKSNRKRWKIAGVILSVIAVISVAVGLVIYNYASMTYDGHKVRIYVDAFYGEKALRDSLSVRLGEDYADRVVAIWKKMADERSLRSGSYVVNTGEKAWQLARRIKNQRQDPVKVTFNNLRNVAQLVKRLDYQLLADSDAICRAIDSVLTMEGVNKNNFSAHFLPDTYEFYWTESPQNVIIKIISNYNKFWNQERLAKADKLHLTPEQVSTLASIVEEETNKSDERPIVARLYLNRLSKGMKLQADPTVKFAIGDFSLKRILNKHLEVNSPYNTYKYAGLPPGPIRLPQASTLDAVLDAPQHNYIYMCAKEDFSGYHNFANDYATHQLNAKKYREALDKNGYN